MNLAAEVLDGGEGPLGAGGDGKAVLGVAGTLANIQIDEPFGQYTSTKKSVDLIVGLI